MLPHPSKSLSRGKQKAREPVTLEEAIKRGAVANIEIKVDVIDPTAVVDGVTEKAFFQFQGVPLMDMNLFMLAAQINWKPYNIRTTHAAKDAKIPAY